jgi:Gas vesicle protein G
MGLFTGLLLLPLAPVRGVAWVAELLAEEAERELEAANSPERALAEIEAARATGEISEEEFEELHGALLDEIFEARGGRGHGDA